MQYLIIGNGIAGVCAAEAIREIDIESKITIVGGETHPPYGRPVISNVLEGSVPYEKLSIRSANFYEKLSLTPVLGERVTHLDTNAKRIRIGKGRWDLFDKLLIASGADHRQHERGEAAHRGAERCGGRHLRRGAGSGKGRPVHPASH